MEYRRVLNDILILNEPETPLKCRKLVISGWDRFISKWAEVLTTKLCREIDSAFWIRTAFFIEHFVHILQKFIKHICSYLYLGEHIDLGAVSSHAQCRSRNEKKSCRDDRRKFSFFSFSSSIIGYGVSNPEI